MRAPRLAPALALGLAAWLPGCADVPFGLPGAAPGPVSRAATGDALAPPGPAGGAAVDPRIVGDRLLAAGEAELALDSYLRAAGADGLDAPLLRAMAAGSLSLGRLGEAEALLRDAVALAPGDAAAWNDLGVVLLEKGRTGEAYEAFRRAFALDPATPAIRENLRTADARLEAARAVEVAADDFTLTRRPDGVFQLEDVR